MLLSFVPLLLQFKVNKLLITITHIVFTDALSQLQQQVAAQQLAQQQAIMQNYLQQLVSV